MDRDLSGKAFRDVAGLFGAQLSVQALSVFLSAWLIRKVPAEDLALWPLVIGLSGVLGGFSCVGVGDYLVRVVPKLVASDEPEGAGRLLRGGLVLNLLATLAMAAAMYVYAEPVGQFLLRKPGQADVVRLLLLPSVLLALGDHLQWAMRSLDMLGGIAVLNLLSGAARLPVMVALFIAAGTRGMVWGIGLAALVRVAFPLVWMRSWTFRRGLVPPHELVVRTSAYYGAGIAALGASRARYLLISALGAPTVLAAYFVAEKVAELLDGLANAAVTAAAPKLSMKAGEGMAEFKESLRKTMRYFYWGFVPVCVLIGVYARPLISLYGGSQYAGAYGLLIVLAGSYLVRLPNALLYEAIKVSCKPLYLPLTNIVLGATSAVLLVLGLSVAKAWGAAVSVVAAYAIGTSVSYALLRRGVGPLNLVDGIRVGGQAMVVGVALTVMLAVAGNSARQPALLAAVGVVFAATYVLLLRGNLTPSETRAVWGLVPSRLRGWPWVLGLERASVRFCTGRSDLSP